jgi:hypothetical protein
MYILIRVLEIMKKLNHSFPKNRKPKKNEKLQKNHQNKKRGNDASL